MNPRTGVRLSALAIVGLATTFVGWLVLRWWVDSGRVIPGLAWVGVVLSVFIAATLVVVALPVRRLRDGRPDRPVSPLRAARTLVLAQAVALTGAVLAGWYASAVLVLLPDADVEPVREDAWWAVAHVIASAALAATGMLVQSWCRLRPPDDEEEARRAGREAAD